MLRYQALSLKPPRVEREPAAQGTTVAAAWPADLGPHHRGRTAVPARNSVCDQMMLSYSIYALALGLPLLFLFRRRVLPRPPPRPALTAQTDDKDSLKTIMQPPRDDLDPPKDDPFTLSALAQYDGSDDSKPIYVSIKGDARIRLRTTSAPSHACFPGDVFDVTRKRDVYGKGGSYNIFAGKDGSMGLGKSSLKLEDAVPDYSTLPENEMKVLDDWHSFFSYVLPMASVRFPVLMPRAGSDTMSSGVSRTCQRQSRTSPRYDLTDHARF